MSVPEGMFRLYSRIEPPLTAGDYRLTSTQELTASRPGEALAAGDLPVDPLPTHLRVRAPQYQLPPDQVLSTFPPAGSEGAYGSRLPQVVIRRRTLPWERAVGDGHPGEPWLALVLVAEGEAEIRLNEPVGDCVTPGVELDTPADVELGNCLAVRKSVVDRIFPTQEEVGLLAHAREVDLHDTELMMGDDDGYLSVVIANRLPLPGHDAAGDEVPVKYLACLVNLSEQFDDLLEKAPEPVPFTRRPLALTELQAVSLADVDHATMGSASYQAAQGLDPDRTVILPHGGAALPKAAGSGGTSTARATLDEGLAAPYEPAAGWTQRVAAAGVAEVYSAMAQPFKNAVVGGFVGGFVGGHLLDRTLVFPVLLHWGFTSTGQVTFRRLMEHLDSGLLGGAPDDPAGGVSAGAPGRPPFESVETGHVGLAHRTRRGDGVRSWYRGPLVPHPTADPPGGRLPLAHTADQVRVVVPDGREDISLASAFEIGRLLALSRPSMVSSLLRWRQLGYQAAQREAVLAGQGGILAELGLLDLAVERDLGGHLAATLADAIATRPDSFLGSPRPLVTAGRAVTGPAEGVNTVLARGFGLSAKALSGSPEKVLGSLQKAEVPLPRPRRGGFDAGLLDGVLQPLLRDRFERVAVDALARDVRLDAVIKGALQRRRAAAGEVDPEPEDHGPDREPGGDR